MNRPGSKWKRASLLVMALCITVSLPLSALAEEPGADAPEGAVYTAVQVGPGEFLARVFRATDAGRPLDGTTRAQYVTIIYNAAGAPEVSGRPTFPDVEEDADYADALAVLDRITREDGSAAPCLRSVESAAGNPPFLV